MPSRTHLPLPDVLSEFALSNSFLGKIIEVCLVTEDHQRTMEGLVRLGVGPFRVYTFDAGNTQSGRWLGPELVLLFDTEAATTTCFETYHFPDGFTYPEPEAWYPAAPPVPPSLRSLRSSRVHRALDQAVAETQPRV